MKTTLLASVALATLLTGCASNSTDEPSLPLTYPTAAREATSDDYFGVNVADPYRWLEDIDSPPS